MSLFSDEPPLLDSLRPEDRDDLLRGGALRRYHRGDVMLLEGDRSSMVLVIRRGWVMISTMSDEGRRVVLAFRGPGDIIGELTALDSRPRSATATALGDVTATVISAETFQRHLATHPAVAAQVMRTLGSRLRAADTHRRELATLPVVRRLSVLLLQLAERGGTADGGGRVVGLPLAQHDLAAAIGATRESTARALGILRERGVIRMSDGGLVVVHRDALRDIADY